MIPLLLFLWSAFFKPIIARITGGATGAEPKQEVEKDGKTVVSSSRSEEETIRYTDYGMQLGLFVCQIVICVRIYTVLLR